MKKITTKQVTSLQPIITLQEAKKIYEKNKKFFHPNSETPKKILSLELTIKKLEKRLRLVQ